MTYTFPVVNGQDLSKFRFSAPPDGNAGVYQRNANKLFDHGLQEEGFHYIYGNGSNGGQTATQFVQQVGGHWDAATGGYPAFVGYFDQPLIPPGWTKHSGTTYQAAVAAMWASVGGQETPTKPHHST
jgi:hypothetical protein